MTENFDISFFAGNFQKPETFKGTDNTYVVIGKLKDEKLALHLEVGAGIVPYKGKPIKAIGFGFRLISVGDGAELAQLFGARGKFKDIKNEDGKKVEGYRLVKTFVPLCNNGLSATQIHELASQHLPELAEFVKSKLVNAGGEIVMDDEQYLMTFKNCLESLDTSVIDLFHLPGVKPDWIEAPKLLPPPEAFGGDDEEGPQDDEPCDPE